jgi:hypothetical protein
MRRLNSWAFWAVGVAHAAQAAPTDGLAAAAAGLGPYGAVEIPSEGAARHHSSTVIQSGIDTQVLGLLAAYPPSESVSAQAPSAPSTAPQGPTTGPAAALAADAPAAGTEKSQAAVQPPASPPAVQSSNRNATKFEAALRVAFSLPFGMTANGDVSLSDAASFTIPIGVDVGVRLGGILFLGGYFQYGFFGSPGATACSSASCSSNTVSVGVEFLFHPLGNAAVDPWFGFGSGWEWLNFNASGPGGTGSAQYSGWEFVNLQVGLDFAIGSLLKLGPYAAFSVGQYSSVRVTLNGGSASGDVTDKALHEWLSFGVRFSVLP